MAGAKKRAPKKTPAKSARKAPANARARKHAAPRKGRGRKGPSAWEQFRTTMFTYAAVGLVGLAVVAVLMLLAGGYMANFGQRVAQATDGIAVRAGFGIEQVVVRGADRATDLELMTALRGPNQNSVLGTSIFGLDAEEARQNIVDQVGWVEAAAVQKLWPSTIQIVIDERRPVALWKDDRHAFNLIDRHGQMLGVVGDDETNPLPILTGVDDPSEARHVLAALVEQPRLFSQVSELVGINGRRFDVVLRNGFLAKLPEDRVSENLARLNGMYPRLNDLADEYGYIDFRDPDAEWAYLGTDEDS